MLRAAERGNAEWARPPRATPHTVFDQACLDFVNSEFADHAGSGRRYDRLVLADWRRWFLRRYGIAGDGDASRRAIAGLMVLRRRIRRLLERRSVPSAADIALFNRILGDAPLTWRLSRESGRAPGLEMRLAPAETGWAAAMALVVSSYGELASSGSLSRVKRCGNDACTFLLFDSTRSRTRRWCDPHACGNLVKVRLHRSRASSSARVGTKTRTGRSAPRRTRRTRGRRSA